ncbi:TolC family protein [Cupriavidus sp. AU9028]|nr:TolC family protein [Cupriavidus sp. AU9028]MBY4896815.1 TolC family protein [Cupriavidus sp. AU9028]
MTLAELRALALRCNPALRLARAAEQQSEADIAIAGQRPNPVLSVGVENINPHAGMGPGGLQRKAVDSVLRVDQQIETAGKAPLRVKTARAGREAASAETGAAAVQQIAQLERSFYQAAIGQERVAALEQALELYERSAAAHRLRLKAGDISRADLTRIELDGLRAQAELRDARASHAEELAELARQAGVQGTLSRMELAVQWPDAGAVLPLPSEEQSAELVALRPDVVAAQARLRAAASARELARAGRVPDITVGAQVERYPVNGGNQQGSGNSFGVFVSIPLMVRHRNDGELARAEADYYTALEERNRVMLEAGNDIARLRAALDAAARAWQQMRDAVLPAAEQVGADAELAFSRGATGVLDLLDARRALRQARLDAIAARGAHASALSAYLAATRAASSVVFDPSYPRSSGASDDVAPVHAIHALADASDR